MELLGYIISGAATIIAVVITNVIGNSKMQHKLELNQAVTDTKLETLTAEVRQHNNFAVKIPLLADRIERIEREMERRKE